MSPTNPDDARYTLAELADLAGVTPRTVRYYLAQGLLPAVGAAGPGAKYDDAHLARLRLIKRLQREHQPLAEIRARLESLADADVLALVETEPEAPTDSALDYIRRVTGRADVSVSPARPPARAVEPLLRRIESSPEQPAPAASSAPAAPVMRLRDLPTEVPPRSHRSQWERVSLGPDVELHIRRPLTRSTAKRVDRLIEIAHDLLEEELP